MMVSCAGVIFHYIFVFYVSVQTQMGVQWTEPEHGVRWPI